MTVEKFLKQRIVPQTWNKGKKKVSPVGKNFSRMEKFLKHLKVPQA